MRKEKKKSKQLKILLIEDASIRNLYQTRLKYKLQKEINMKGTTKEKWEAIKQTIKSAAVHWI